MVNMEQRDAMDKIKNKIQGDLTMYNVWKLVASRYFTVKMQYALEGEYGYNEALAMIVNLDTDFEISGYLSAVELPSEYLKEIEQICEFRTVDDILSGHENDKPACISKLWLFTMAKMNLAKMKDDYTVVRIPSKEWPNSGVSEFQDYMLDFFLSSDGRIRLLEVVSTRILKMKKKMEGFVFGKSSGLVHDLLEKMRHVDMISNEKSLPRLEIAIDLWNQGCWNPLTKLLDERRGFTSISTFYDKFQFMSCNDEDSFLKLLSMRHFSELEQSSLLVCSVKNMVEEIIEHTIKNKPADRKRYSVIINSRVCSTIWSTENENFSSYHPVFVVSDPEESGYVISPIPAKNFVYFHPKMLHMGMTFYVDSDSNVLFLGFSKMRSNKKNAALSVIRSKFESLHCNNSSKSPSKIEDNLCESKKRRVSKNEKVRNEKDKPYTLPGPSHRERKSKPGRHKQNDVKREVEKEESLEKLRKNLLRMKMEKEKEEERLLERQACIDIGNAILFE